MRVRIETGVHNPYQPVCPLTVRGFADAVRELTKSQQNTAEMPYHAALLVQRLKASLTAMTSPLSRQEIRSIVYSMGRLACRGFLEGMSGSDNDFSWVVQIASRLVSCASADGTEQYRLQEIANVLDGLGLMAEKKLLPCSSGYFVMPLFEEASYLLLQPTLEQRDFLLSLNGVLTGVTRFMWSQLLLHHDWPRAFELIGQCHSIFDARVLGADKTRIIASCENSFRRSDDVRWGGRRETVGLFSLPSGVQQERGPYVSPALLHGGF